MKTSTERNFIRILHLLTGGIIAMYVYSPWSSVLLFSFITKIIVIPGVIITGLWLWKGHRVKKMLFKNKVNS